MARLVTIDDVEAARANLAGVVAATPVLSSRAVSAAAGATVLLKCEQLQRTGSFKLRGAYHRLSLLSPGERERGVVCASAGNHAQGVALSARLLDVQATVFMPEGAPLPKVEATRGYGAQVELVEGGVGDALAVATAYARERDAVFVHPFEHPDVIAGQGTLGLDIVDDVGDIGTVVLPIGGGGLISGVAVAVRARAGRSTRIVGVQAEQAAAVVASLAAGVPVTVPPGDTIADGIAVSRPGELTLAHISALVDEVVTVDDQTIARAVLLLAERVKQVVEPAGAAGLAALLAGAVTRLPEPVVVALCGGNVDPLLLARIIQSGLASEGRYLALRTRVEDRPGALLGVLELIAEHGANVVGVEHHRLRPQLGLMEVELELALETRGAPHSDTLIAALGAAGYPVER